MTNSNITTTETSINTILSLLESGKITLQQSTSMLSQIETKELQSETGLKGSKAKIIDTILKEFAPKQKTDEIKKVKINKSQIKKELKNAVKDAFASEIYSLSKLVKRVHDKESMTNEPIANLLDFHGLTVSIITAKRLLDTWAKIDATKLENFNKRLEQYTINLNAYNQVASLCIESDTPLSIDAPKEPKEPTMILTYKDGSKRSIFSLNNVLQGIDYLGRNK